MLPVQSLFDRLFSFYGPQGWWPVSDSRSAPATYRARLRLSDAQKLEVCVGAILAQNTAWTNASRAVENLRHHMFLDLRAIAACDEKQLASLIRSAGFFNQKARRLKSFCAHVREKHGTVSGLLAQPLETARAELLALPGIGPETADSMLLYAGRRPVLVVDAYARRLVERAYGHEFDYAQCQQFLASGLSADAALFSECHALIVAHAKRFCRAKPLCGDCFLKPECRFGKRI